MSSLEAEVVEAFSMKLKGSESVKLELAEALSAMFSEDRLPKPEQVIAVISEHSGDPIA